MLKKIKKIIKKLFFVKFRFFSPKETDLIIFDNVGLKDLKINLLKDVNYFVLKNRVNEIDEIYVSLKILLKIMLRLYMCKTKILPKLRRTEEDICPVRTRIIDKDY